MKTTLLSSLLVIVFALSLPTVAQHKHADITKEEKKESSTKDIAPKAHQPMAEMGNPTFEKSQDGVHIAVWLITQEEHKKMMDEKMKEGKHSMKMDHGMMHESKDTSENRHVMHDMKGMDHGMMHDSKDTSGGMHMMHGMEGMDRDAKNDDHKSAMAAMMTGTHHIMVTLTYDQSKKEITDAEVSATPSIQGKQSSSVKLSQMMNHFGGGLELKEKGSCTIALVAMVDGMHYETQFSYEVK